MHITCTSHAHHMCMHLHKYKTLDTTYMYLWKCRRGIYINYYYFNILGYMLYKYSGRGQYILMGVSMIRTTVWWVWLAHCSAYQVSSPAAWSGVCSRVISGCTAIKNQMYRLYEGMAAAIYGYTPHTHTHHNHK